MENFTNFEKTLKTYDTSDRQNMYVDILNLSGNKENDNGTELDIHQND